VTDLTAPKGHSALRGAEFMKNISIFSLSAGLIILGIAGLLTADFALQWQPVPEGIIMRSGIARLSAAFELAAGLLLYFRPARMLAIRAVAVFVFIWVCALHLPRVAASPTDLVIWLGCAEISVIGLAALILSEVGWAAKTPRNMFIRSLFGLALVVFGSTHFVFADFTAQMIPGWLPARLFWAYLTGAGHIAAGLVLLSAPVLALIIFLLAPVTDRFEAVLRAARDDALSGRLARVAAESFALMISSFVFLLHVPRVAAMITNRAEWTMLAIALCIQAAAWAMAALVTSGSALTENE
jgi:uncharacterized membrane protein